MANGVGIEKSSDGILAQLNQIEEMLCRLNGRINDTTDSISCILKPSNQVGFGTPISGPANPDEGSVPQSPIEIIISRIRGNAHEAESRLAEISRRLAL